MFDLSIKIEKPRASNSDPDAYRRFYEGGMTALAAVLAARLKRRVGVEGRPTRLPAPYPNDKRPKYVSASYPDQGGKLTKRGTIYYRNSAEFHRRVRGGTFDVSRGMWSSLSVVQGQRNARIVFRGRSPGQNPLYGTAKQYEALKAGGKKGARAQATIAKRAARGRQVSNALKAATIYKSKRVNVLDPTAEEIGATMDAVTTFLASRLGAQVDLDLRWYGDQPKSVLARAMFSALANPARAALLFRGPKA